METTGTKTITLTDSAPVSIREDHWPVIAVGRYSDYDNQHECQANRTWKCSIMVRQHADGRLIVYGVYDYDTVFQGERGITVKAGVVLDAGANEVAAIRRVGETLVNALSDGHSDLTAHVSQCVRECIANLPARELL